MKGSRKPAGEAEGRIRPTMDSLRVFVEFGDRLKAAAGQGTNFASLSEAAEGMSSKSNVFRALAELRKVYGRQLVNRSTVTLTSEGEAVYTWAKDLLELHARGRRWPLGGREQVHIGTSSWILTFLVPEMVRAFLADLAKRKRLDPDLPEVDLGFGEYDVEQILVALRKGAVHAGLAAVFTTGTFPGLAVRTVRERVSTVMIASSQHERWGLAGLPLPASGGRHILVENYATVAALVRAGVAVGFIPQLHRGDAPNHPAYQGLEVYRVKDQLPLRTLAILRRSGEELPGHVEAFLRIAEEKLR
jgi:DNA-binding transcriptional LysR family regulator